MPGVVVGDHAGKVRELALDQLGYQLDIAEAETYLARGHIDRNGFIGVAKQALHFQYGLARHNNVVLALYAFDHGTAMCQAVAVGSHGAYKARLEHGSEEHTSEIRELISHLYAGFCLKTKKTK